MHDLVEDFGYESFIPVTKFHAQVARTAAIAYIHVQSCGVTCRM